MKKSVNDALEPKEGKKTNALALVEKRIEMLESLISANMTPGVPSEWKLKGGIARCEATKAGAESDRRREMYRCVRLA